MPAVRAVAASPSADPSPLISFTVDGRAVDVADDGASLLEVLRDRLGITSPKDGCSPQGQCGCCTVLVDGAPRVACVTPARRVRGRSITTLDGLEPRVRDEWARAFVDHGASQCGFCTPGIILRLSALSAEQRSDRAQVDQALLAHLCRCTGWQTIAEATASIGAPSPAKRDLDSAARRATLEGRTPQQVGPEIPLGMAPFADDTAPREAAVAVARADEGFAAGETLSGARHAAAKVQGRRTTISLRHPLELPTGDWALTLRTTWVEPAYLEPDASWAAPGVEAATSLANGGAFGGKVASEVGAAARQFADEADRAVRVLYNREDVVRRGPKRPPIAAGIRADATGVVRVARTPGVAAAIASVAPGLVVEEVDVAGPLTSAAARAAGWAEAAVLLAALRRDATVTSPDGATAHAEVSPNGVRVRIDAGEVLDEVVLRSYCIGAAHMALGWVWSEGIAVDEAGEVHDLTIRSFGILRSKDTPHIDVEILSSDRPPVNGSDAVFAAVTAAAWIAEGLPPQWPTRRGGAR